MAKMRCVNAYPWVSTDGESISLAQRSLKVLLHNILGASCVTQTSPTQNKLPPMIEAKYGLSTTLSV